MRRTPGTSGSVPFDAPEAPFGMFAAWDIGVVLDREFCVVSVSRVGVR